MQATLAQPLLKLIFCVLTTRHIPLIEEDTRNPNLLYVSQFVASRIRLRKVHQIGSRS